tara:strand:+ start:303 stop:1919 length:1617 start_codon:yes stop_codon:yes gene_type:complete
VRLAVGLFFLIASASADEIVLTPTISENLLPGISSFMTSGDATMTGDEDGCQLGEACTGAAGGTYSTTVDLTNEMTIAEINAGFDLAYGVTVDSHSSNASLPTCDQTGGDCQDNFNLTLTLQDGTTVVEKYEHDFVLDYANLREYQFEQTVVSNSWVELSMLMELYGQDAGYPSGLYGPQFTDPWLTTGYDAISFVQSQIVDVIQDDMDDALDFVMEEIIAPEPEVVVEVEQEVVAEPEPEIIIVIEAEPEPEETFVVDAEEIFSNPVLSEIVGAGDTVTVTLTETGTGNIVDSFQVNVQSETVTTLPLVDASTADTTTSSLAPTDNIAPAEPMGFEEQPEMSVTETFEEMPEMEAAMAELDAMDSEPAAMEVEVAEVDAPEMSEPEPAEVEIAESEPEAESAETEVAENDSAPEPESTEATEPNLVASSSDEEPEPEKEASSEDKAKSKKQRIVKKISTRVMATLSQNYEAAMQGAALSVMRMSAPTYKSTELQDLEDWYVPVKMDGGTNYDHPSAMWIAAQAGQDMSDLVKMQWRK